MNEEFVIKTSVWKTILYLMVCLLFVIAGVFIIFDSNSLTKTIAGVLCIGFFGFGFFVLLYQVLNRRPRILIDEKGITDRMLGIGRINWEDIEYVKLRSSKNRSIFLKLVKSQKSSEILSSAKNKKYNFDGDLDLGILALNLNLIDTEPQNVYEVILKHIPEKQLNNSDKMYEDFDRNSEIK